MDNKNIKKMIGNTIYINIIEVLAISLMFAGITAAIGEFLIPAIVYIVIMVFPVTEIVSELEKLIKN